MKTRFCIKPFVNPSGAEVFRVQGRHTDGQYIRENFTTRGEALTRCQNLEREAANLAPLPTITTRLTSEQAAEAESCFRRLTGHPLTLTKAVDFALGHYKASQKEITVTDAWTKFEAEKTAQNLRPDTLANLAWRIERLVAKHGGQFVNSITADEVRALVKRGGPRNQVNNRLVLSNFFNWCVANEFCGASPLAKIGTVKVDRDEPETLTLEQARALVHHAKTYKDGAILAYVTLALFCGIRPKEISRLTWEDADTKSGTVNISAKVAKMRARRIVDMSENAALMLFHAKITHKPIVPANIRADLLAVRNLAGIVEWPVDVLRHTAITMHLAFHEHEGKTALWAGNSPDIIQKHYRNPKVTKAMAAEFWQIDGNSQVIPLPTSKAA